MQDMINKHCKSTREEFEKEFNKDGVLFSDILDFIEKRERLVHVKSGEEFIRSLEKAVLEIRFDELAQEIKDLEVDKTLSPRLPALPAFNIEDFFKVFGDL